MKKIKFFKKASISTKLKMFGYGMIFPLFILIGYLLYSLITFCNSYNQSVKNVTAANNYNINFKEDIDYDLYRMIAGSVHAENLTERAGLDSPYQLVSETRKEFQLLLTNTTGSGNERRVRIILKYLDTLENRIRDIDDTVTQSGHYDENMVALDNNIHILTELTQEQIQDYIYYEVANLESVRMELRQQEEQAIQLSCVMLLVVFIIISAMTAAMSKGVSQPIMNLCKITDQVAKGNFEAQAELKSVEGGDEIDVLTNSFNCMILQIGELVDNIKQEQLNLRDTELKLLQAQINPHFLYNTLDTIIWLAEDNKKEEVVSMVSSLSDFFRTTLSEGRAQITLEEEELQVRSYLQIQQFRYRDIMEYTIDIPKELYQYSIIKLTLQPLVENALYHGIKNKRGLGKIQVTGKLMGDIIVLAVEDNGIGMEQEALQALAKKVKQRRIGENIEGSFGLCNVDERLRLNYGPEYGLTFHSKHGEWTKVEVTIPAKIYYEVKNEPDKKLNKVKS